jgi:hypothetical protein
VSSERSKTIELHRPITYKGSELHEITVNPPTIGALRQAQAHTRSGRSDEAQTKFSITLVARCAGLNDEAVEMLEGDSFMEALEFASGFLGDDKKTASDEEST